jgi:hypothetical protein
VIGSAGYKLDTAPYGQWLNEIRRRALEKNDATLLSLVGMLRGHQPFQRNQRRFFDCKNTLAILNGRCVSGIIDSRALLTRWLTFLESMGAFRQVSR